MFAPPPARRYRRREVIAALAACLARPARSASQPFALEGIADGAYAHFGQISLTSEGNAGDIANLGVIIGADSVAVIDTGGSVAVGRALLGAIRAATSKPVRYVINTHEHPDHLFGNAAFASSATFVGHHNLPSELAKRGDYYLRSYAVALGDAAIREVRIIPPSLLVQDETVIDLGARRLRLTAWSPAAHSNCDLTVLDEASGILYAGDLVFLQHVPVLDGSLKGWLSLIPRLAKLPAKHVVPGHGRLVAPWPDGLADTVRYLSVLAEDTRREIAAGTPMAAAVRRIAQSERGRWKLFEDYNPRNATAAFSELEWE